MQDQKKKVIRVGITLPDQSQASVGQALWSTGHVQNAAFLARVFEKVEGVKVFALGSFQIAKALKMEHTNKGPGYLDVIIEVGTKLSPTNSQQFREGGGLLVHYVLGNTMALNMEHVQTLKTPGQKQQAADVPYGRYHRIWMLPHVIQMNFDYYSLMHRCVVREAPMVWAPDFLPKDFGYVAPQEGQPKIVACFEPNVSVVKTSHWSMLVAENCEYTTVPQIDKFRVYASADVASGSPAFNSFGESLTNLVGKLEFWPRIPAPDAFKGVAAVISHQWMNEFNYNHWEALYGKFPLIHNSDHVLAGYKFRSWDTLAGGHLLNAVLQEHEKHRAAYEEKAAAVIAGLSPAAVRPKYTELLMELIEERDRVLAG